MENTRAAKWLHTSHIHPVSQCSPCVLQVLDCDLQAGTKINKVSQQTRTLRPRSVHAIFPRFCRCIPVFSVELCEHTPTRVHFLEDVCNEIRHRRRDRQSCCHETTLQGTSISPSKALFEDDFLFPRWDMLVPKRVTRIMTNQPETQRISWNSCFSFSYFSWESRISPLSWIAGPNWCLCDIMYMIYVWTKQ